MRVLAFEDSYDIAELLADGGVDFESLTFEQKWTTANALKIIAEFGPDVLLLDHFIPPQKGGDVLVALNRAVAVGEMVRPECIIGMSSATIANRKMLENGANYAIIKFDLPSLDVWPRA